MNIEDFDSIKDYMSSQFGSKSRGEIRTYLRRLENCFNISYNLYFGEINKGEYNSLINKLEEMIIRRFSERGEKHQDMDDWDSLKIKTFEQINNKKASLFVIYDNYKPIDICLNYHYDSIMINSIRSYDIDYSKFRLGYIDIYKQLELCFENNYKIFDLCIGDMRYKRQWCNYTYLYNSHIVYYKKSIINGVLAAIISTAFKLKTRLENHRDNKFKKNGKKECYIAGKAKNEEVIQKKDISISFNSNIIDNLPENIGDYLKIDIEDIDYTSLRKFYYNLLYLNFEEKNEVTLYKSTNRPDYYLFSGNKNFAIFKS